MVEGLVGNDNLEKFISTGVFSFLFIFQFSVKNFTDMSSH